MAHSELIIRPMQRSSVRVTLMLILLVIAIFAPLVASGYLELQNASTAKTYPEVARHYWNAAQRIPWRADLYELAGHAHYYAKQYTQADAVYQKALRRGALSSDGWVAWGDVVYLNGDPPRATQIWEQALQQPNPSENLYSRLSETYKEKGEYAKAAQYLQNYVSLHMDDAGAHYRLGLLLTLTDPDSALQELITSSQLDPQMGPAVETLRSALNQASLSDSGAERLVLTGRGLGLVQEWKLARVAFEDAIQVEAENAEAWAWLGEAKQHLAEDGSADLEKAYQLDPMSSTVRGLRGLYFQRTGNFRNALTEFESAALLEGKNPAWQVSIGEVYSKLGDLIRALQAYQAATALAPQDPQYWRLLALFCAQNNVNVKDVGIPAAQEVVMLVGQDASAVDLLGWLLLIDKRYEEAERMLLQALKLDPRNSSAHLHLGMLYLEEQKHEQARSHFVSARDLGSTDAQAILNQYFP